MTSHTGAVHAPLPMDSEASRGTPATRIRCAYFNTCTFGGVTAGLTVIALIMRHPGLFHNIATRRAVCLVRTRLLIPRSGSILQVGRSRVREPRM
jgi:hypothetical protein